MNYAKDFNLEGIIRNALKEDVGKRDITTVAIIPPDKLATGVFKALEDCVVCGLGVVSRVFRLQDKKIKFKPQVKEGAILKKGKIIARVSGRARSILTAERVALNFLSHLCGIATKTRKFVEKVKPYKVKIVDTRKTTPGLRILEKYAVRIGGGFNHRMSLDEMVLIKDNHLKVVSCPMPAGRQELSVVRQKIHRTNKFEIEVKNLREFKEVLKLKPDIIMLDNMSIKDMKKAVKIRNNSLLTTCLPAGRAHYPLPKLEASGGITLKNVRQLASTGVDMLSVGELTHSVTSIDISLEIL